MHFIFLPGIMPSVLQLAKHSIFWHLAKNLSNNFTSSSFHLLFHLHGTTVISSVSKVKRFSQTFVKNSTLDDSELVLPSRPLYNYFMSLIEILRNDVFHALSDLNPWKAYGPDGVPSIILKNCASVLAPCLAKLFQLCLSTSTFPSCWKFAYMQPVSKMSDHSNP
ncbi:hypothetical protein E2C01_033055 [Portunus trituberculatus]|uniref:RNA-directed DNA polymerase from mobile element jockey n=1 Tax=Portunus trituberculatus TaxID=210409 RepID=A0A5B7F2Y4_PORTR|nr:hypothetical protein [Portunus trituberculatus]